MCYFRVGGLGIWGLGVMAKQRSVGKNPTDLGSAGRAIALFADHTPLEDPVTRAQPP